MIAQFCITQMSLSQRKKKGSEKSKMNYLSIFSMLFSVLI